MVAEANQFGHGQGTSEGRTTVLNSILKTLRVNEDARQQELAYRILDACPELVAGYDIGRFLQV